MRRVLISFVSPIFFFNVFCHQESFAQTESNKEIRDKFQGFIDVIESEKNKQQGFALAILYKGKVIYKTTAGHQKGNKKPITDKTLFPLASVSKAVSATAIALMVENGKLNLDEKFKIPYIKSPINLSNILSHTTGYQFSGNRQIEQGMTRSALLNTLKTQKQNCKPGNCYRYSNATFSLVEEALNLKKLNLNLAIKNLNRTLNTQEIKLLKKDSESNFAYPHTKAIVNGKVFTKQLPFPPFYPKTAPASAGIFASINGMIEVYKLAFGYKPELLSKETSMRMLKPVISTKKAVNWNLNLPIDEKKLESQYALGWRVLKVKNSKNKDLIYHPGYINGVKSFIGYIPSKEVGIIILTNQDSKFALKNGINFWRIALNNKSNPNLSMIH